MIAYRGRFAPSPTGPLHFGSLIAAVASYCEARARRGQWLLRMEDLDRPRCSPGAAADILRTLERCGMTWDGEPVYQSVRTRLYAAALERLKSAALAYPCGCSRKEIADSALASDGGLVYPGTCRHGLPPGRGARTWRVRVEDEPIELDDAIQGHVSQRIASEVGDFVLQRADGFFAYQLAVVVDDAEQGITDIVRGADLLGSTPRQIHLQHLLRSPLPRYAHVPVAVNARGEKLSKQTLAPAVEPGREARWLVSALAFLGQEPPQGMERGSPADIWDWAVPNWNTGRVPRVRSLPSPIGC